MDQSKEVLVDSEVAEEADNVSVELAPPRRSSVAPPVPRKIKIKKFLSYSTIAMFLFLTGVQYVLILPTAFDYVVYQLGGSSNQYGSLFEYLLLLQRLYHMFFLHL